MMFIPRPQPTAGPTGGVPTMLMTVRCSASGSALGNALEERAAATRIAGSVAQALLRTPEGAL